jgi:hypothetical protein
MTPTRPDLDALEQLCAAAQREYDAMVLSQRDHMALANECRTALPALVAEVRRLEADWSERVRFDKDSNVAFDAVCDERDAAVQRAADIEQATVAGIVRHLHSLGAASPATLISIESGAWRGRGAP